MSGSAARAGGSPARAGARPRRYGVERTRTSTSGCPPPADHGSRVRRRASSMRFQEPLLQGTDRIDAARPPLRSVGVREANGLRGRIDAVLDRFVAAQQVVLDSIDPELAPVLGALRDLLHNGGKRLRPSFCYWGWRGAGGPDDAEIIVAAAALELLQAGALVHDDYIDESDTRRGRPAAHRRD